MSDIYPRDNLPTPGHLPTPDITSKCSGWGSDATAQLSRESEICEIWEFFSYGGKYLDGAIVQMANDRYS